jgi:hypothetical protein
LKLVLNSVAIQPRLALIRKAPAEIAYNVGMFIKTKLRKAADRFFGVLHEPNPVDIHNDEELYARVRENGRAVVYIMNGRVLNLPKVLSPAEFECAWQGD